jgi:hypothetical protein
MLRVMQRCAQALRISVAEHSMVPQLSLSLSVGLSLSLSPGLTRPRS